MKYSTLAILFHDSAYQNVSNLLILWWPGRELNPRHADFQSVYFVPHLVLSVRCCIYNYLFYLAYRPNASIIIRYQPPRNGNGAATAAAAQTGADDGYQTDGTGA